MIEASAARTSAARAARRSAEEAPAGGASCVAEPRWGACRRFRRTFSAAVALADSRRSRSLRLETTALSTSTMARTATSVAAAAPRMTSVRRRPRRRGARTKTDRPQREQRSRSERSSKPQCGHVRDCTSVIVGGIGLTSVDIMSGYCQSADVDRFDAGPQPAGRPPAPGRLAYVQAFLNTLLGPRARRRGRAVVLACGLRRLAAGPPLRRRRRGRRPRARDRTARGAAGPVPGQPRRGRGAGGADRPGPRRACGRAGRRADAEPAHRRPGACGRRPGRRVRARPGDRLRRARRRELRAAEGVPARPLRLGVLRRLAQPLGPVVLDAHLRQPDQGRGLPPPPRRVQA